MSDDVAYKFLYVTLYSESRVYNCTVIKQDRLLYSNLPTPLRGMIFSRVRSPPVGVPDAHTPRAPLVASRTTERT